MAKQHHHTNVQPDGTASPDQQIPSPYFHGLFDKKTACDALLQWAGLDEQASPDYIELREKEINRLAACVEEHLDIPELMNLMY